MKKLDTSDNIYTTEENSRIKNLTSQLRFYKVVTWLFLVTLFATLFFGCSVQRNFTTSYEVDPITNDTIKVITKKEYVYPHLNYGYAPYYNSYHPYRDFWYNNYVPFLGPRIIITPKRRTKHVNRNTTIRSTTTNRGRVRTGTVRRSSTQGRPANRSQRGSNNR